jgi:glycogen synthase
MPIDAPGRDGSPDRSGRSFRLLFINYEYPPLGGGAATASRSLIREWTAMGCEVETLTSHFPGLPRCEQADGATIRRLWAGRRRRDRGRIGEMSLFMAGAAWAGAMTARRRRPDAVIAFIGIPAGPPAWLINRLTGIPYVVALRGGDVPGFRCEGIETFHRLLAPLTRKMWRDAAAVTANSAGLAALARAFAPDVAVDVIHNGVDATLFHPATDKPAFGGVDKPAFGGADQAPFGGADQAPFGGADQPAFGGAGQPAFGGVGRRPARLLAVGRLTAQKGVDVLLDALARPGLEGAVLDVVGDGDWRGRLEAQAGRLGLTGRVNFPGWRDRDALAAVYRAADVFVLPSRDEGMPNVLLEAMASGLPAVASRVAGAEDLVADGETGFLVPPDDPEALATALRRLIGDPALRAAMGARARMRAEREFSWRAAAAAYLDLLRPQNAAGS